MTRLSYRKALRWSFRAILLLGSAAILIGAIEHLGAAFDLWPAPDRKQDVLACAYFLAACAVWQMREDVT